MKKLICWILAALLLLIAGCTPKPEAPYAADAPAPDTAAGEDEPAACSNIVITVIRNAETVTERAITSETEIQMVEEILFDYMVKSAAWEGIEASELEDCIILSFDRTPASGRQSYYQFEAEGRPVLQAGEAGMYTVMSDEAYDKLLRLAGLSS